MLERVGQRLDGEQSERHRDVGRQATRRDFKIEPQIAAIGAETLLDLMRQVMKQLLHVDRIEILDLVQDAMDKRERIDARAAPA